MTYNLEEITYAIVTLTNKVNQLEQQLEQLQAQSITLPPSKKRLTRAQFNLAVAKQLKKEIPALSNWVTKEVNRTLTMRPTSGGLSGRTGLYIEGARNYFIAIDFNKEIVNVIPPNVLPNELPSRARHANTRRFGFVDMEDAIGFIQGIESKIETFSNF